MKKRNMKRKTNRHLEPLRVPIQKPPPGPPLSIDPHSWAGTPPILVAPRVIDPVAVALRWPGVAHKCGGRGQG